MPHLAFSVICLWEWHQIAYLKCLAPDEADLCIYRDALAIGLGIGIPNHQCEFTFDLTIVILINSIVYAEAFIICCAIHWVTI